MHTYQTALPHHKILKKDGIYSCTHDITSYNSTYSKTKYQTKTHSLFLAQYHLE